MLEPGAALDDGPLSSLEGCVAALADGRVTSQDLVRRGLDRIERFDGPDGLNAVIAVAPDPLAEARAADERRARGQARGPLDGVPFTVKDCIEARGMPTTHGSRLFEHWVPSQDAPVVARLREAGMVALAKVSLDDFAAACWGESSILGPMRNPYDPARTVGGSSGGAAVTVAAGYAPLSLGTDTGGSLRIPAALCGVATLRPSTGVLPLDGVFPRSPSQDTVGPMASSVAGLAMAFDALRDLPVRSAPSSAPVPTGLRLGIVEGGLAIWGDDPEGPVLRRFRELVDALRASGVDVGQVPAPPRELLDASVAINAEARQAVDAYLARGGMPTRDFDDLLASGAMTENALLTFTRHAAVEPDEAATAQVYERRRELRDATHALLLDQRLDAVMYPSVQRVPTWLGQEQAGVFTRWSEHTGFPAVAVPMGMVDTGEGPCSTELLGLGGDDDRLLDVARAVEAVAQTLSRTTR
ncbi:amidase [Xylanimonas protaetiae]|uniref:Amidase n=1 Tax=Xylanimonas protaetiae TaxID=2509457 RepID=A0A4P6F6L4_9MICO|nr:amidase [Xylanimonas protaetiae]QAY71640.1 amidase [Xylanimonas protaetiae]